MKNIIFALCALCTSFTLRATSIDSLSVLMNTDTSTTLIAHYSTSGSAYVFVVRDVTASFQSPVVLSQHVVPAGGMEDTISSHPLGADSMYYYRFMLSDGITVDTLIDSVRTLVAPATPAHVVNLMARNLTQSGALLTVEYEDGGSLMFLDWQQSSDEGATWSTIAIHTANGNGMDSLQVQHSTQDTLCYQVLGWNLVYPTSTDTTNSVCFAVLPPRAQSPFVDSLAVTGITETGGRLFIRTVSDSVGSSVVVRISPDNFVTTLPLCAYGITQGQSDTSLWVDGFGPDAPVWIEVVVVNVLGADTVQTSFTTNPIIVGPPTMTILSVSVVGNEVAVDAVYSSYDNYPNTIAGFEIVRATDTMVSIFNSGIDTLVQSFGALHFNEMFSGIPSGSYMVRGWIMNSSGFYATPCVPFSITTTGIEELLEMKMPSEYLIYTIHGVFIGRCNTVFPQEWLSRSALPSAIYIFISPQTKSTVKCYK